MKVFLIAVTILLITPSFYSQEDAFVTDIAILPEIVVKSDNTQAALDLYSQNIIDYRVYGEKILVLKKKKGAFYLGIEERYASFEDFQLNIVRPRFIVIDCFKNVHILNDNFAYQVFITDAINIIATVPLQDFEETVKKCKGEFDETLIFDSLSNSNQEYFVSVYDKKTMKSKVIYNEVDAVALKSLEIHRLNSGEGKYNLTPTRLSQGYDHAQGHVQDNGLGSSVISTKNTAQHIDNERRRSTLEHNRYIPQYSSGGYRNPHSEKRDFFEAMIEKRVNANKIEIGTYKIGDTIVIVDQLNRTVSLYSKKGELIVANDLEFSGKIEEILQDPETEELYFTSRNDQLYNVHRLNVSTGKTVYAGGFKNISLTRTRKIYDGWIYYRVLKNDYYKLYRTRLKGW
ncbi:MAG: hypothetical protein COA33_013200 [Fluviicola sp.]|nr:hypothetical protein [Fluviicola sp.]